MNEYVSASRQLGMFDEQPTVLHGGTVAPMVSMKDINRIEDQLKQIITKLDMLIEEKPTAKAT